jgi:hypothetical protein
MSGPRDSKLVLKHKSHHFNKCIIVYVLSYADVSTLDSIALNGWITGKWRIVKGITGDGHDLIYYKVCEKDQHDAHFP